MRRLIVGGVVALALVPALACLGPTEITVSIRTNAPCTDPAKWKGVALYVGAPGIDVESKAPTLTTTACDASGSIGSIVIKPSGANDADLGVRVVAGLDKNPEECRTASYAGCIVARRTARYIPHSQLDLVIDLTLDCAGHGCDVNHTCVTGICTDTVIAAVPVSDDGGVIAHGDASGAESGAGGAVRCGDTSCPANDPAHACCLVVDSNSGAETGSCRPSSECVSPSAALLCDKASDCPGYEPDAGAFASSTCAAGTSDGPVTCCAVTADARAGSPLKFHVYSSFCGRLCSCPTVGALGNNSRIQLCNDHLPCHGDACLPFTVVMPTYSYCGDLNANQ
jgi:hypothetical protein